MSQRNEALRNYLAENPRMMGVAFAVLLALTQAGNTAAAHGGGISGP
ncbi:DUF7503 family protein [Haladaptatus halobius]|jgi:hypothetical protein|nr:hypothetical protein [Haladaptatus halobius]